MVVVVGPASADTTVYDDARPFSSNISYYIAAAWGEQEVYAGRVPSRLRVGDGSTYSVGSVEYRNVPLNSNTQYSIFTRYDIHSGATLVRIIDLSVLTNDIVFLTFSSAFQNLLLSNTGYDSHNIGKLVT